MIQRRAVLPGTCGTLASSDGDSSYMFLSTGSPGSILFNTPSSPAINNAVYARYGFSEDPADDDRMCYWGFR